MPSNDSGKPCKQSKTKNTMSQLKAFKIPETRTAKKVMKVFIAGVGAVGSTLLKQIAGFQPNGNQIRVIGVCNSKHMLWFDHSQQNYSLRSLLRGPARDWEEIMEKLSAYEKGSVVFVDTTGNQEVSDLYVRLLSKKIHVVTASKLANTRTQKEYDHLHKTARINGARFLFETNVGAGLPIIETIQNLLITGDVIQEISGVLSGTMTYLFSELDQGRSFSKAVIQARALGYAEPDPRDDLSGEDVARKFMILARICGHRLEREDREVESLIPEKLRDVDATDFLENLHKYDTLWAEKVKEASEKGQRLRYTGKLADGKITIGVESVPADSSIGRLTGTNNLIQIKSSRYSDQNLVIQGPGAGKEVTAAGVLADILKIR